MRQTKPTATAILRQIRVFVLYEHFAVMAGKTPSDVSFVNRGTALLRTGELIDILICSELWLVKLSFLMFFRQLGSKLKG